MSVTSQYLLVNLFGKNMNENSQKTIYTSNVSTPIGEMVIIADETYLYFLEFIDAPYIAQKMKRFEVKINSKIDKGRTNAMKLFESELHSYFQHSLHAFQTSIFLFGTPFQKQVWNQLQEIAYGKTVSYSELAQSVDNPKGYRAVARANSMNCLPIIIPCHRVINANGGLGGYSSGLWRKTWLLEHELKANR
jgi:AraC family transcriptional regulator, regulatory protein of adaptative response / methylated-DNA-[protein]-cysteine methyltransferase